ncbi:oleate hydratase [Carnobacterium divergens]|uniref:oleate hydratase n=1 Tax=Carnobacterium divergens TaxID=2748 RepID=UPI001071BDF5|nr:oleate hydratase [Carnobacterium divergens]TFI70863.1 oleate hydratase [Carnobacterium divergens]
MNKKQLGLLAAGATAIGSMYGVKKLNQLKLEKNKGIDEEIEARYYGDQQVYLIGGGIGSLASAAFLIRDANFEGKNIHIIEGMKILGGSNDGAGNNEKGFICRGGRMLNEETYENFWDLFRSIPSLEMPHMSVTEEILNFDHLHPTHAQARLIDKNAEIVNAHKMGFNNKDRAAMSKLLATPEEELDDLSIQDWFAPHFFETNFWYMWQTTFAFQKWSSLFELRRYMNRMMLEFSRIDTLEGVTRTAYNQYESLILPLKNFLEKHEVDFILDKTVTDIDFVEGSDITATAIHLTDGEVIELKPEDKVMMTNACMTDSTTEGDYHTPAPKVEKRPISGELWYKIAQKKPNLGNPAPFFDHEEETNWESFTVTCKGNTLLKRFEEFSGNIPGSGALMTFKDSNWLMSIVVAAQPHFKKQDLTTTIFWGYGLYPDRVGDYVKKTMRECTGEEILYELICQFKWQDDWEKIKEDIVNVIPCYMPYIDAQFQPRKMSDRPKVVPTGSTNFAMISQFVEIPKDMVFTEEYSVRAAKTAVYTLFDITKEICPVTPHNRNPKVVAKAAKTMFR